MTNQEAIERLKDILEEATETEEAVCYVTDCDEEPLKMAIEALEKQIEWKNLIFKALKEDSFFSRWVFQNGVMLEGGRVDD